ncbi:MAG: carboxypeptidase-like regulatory domain-containing protein [Bacteroidota bacterium]
MKYTILPCLLFCTTVLTAQQINLNGLVSIHNSGYENGKTQYVKNAYVSVDFTTPTNTDDTGQFNLVFSGVPSGTDVKVTVEKDGWEIVNKLDLQEVVVGRLLPVRIYLAKKGQIAQARTELYNVSLKTLTARHDRMIAQLRKNNAESQEVIQELEQKLNIAISNRFEAEELLNKQLVTTKQRLPDFSLRLAKVNLDFASEMYRTAYEHFKKGEIEEAIEAIDEAVLDKEAEDAKIKLWQARADIANLDTALVSRQAELKAYIKGVYLVARSYQAKAKNQEAVDLLTEAVAWLPNITVGEAYNKLLCYQKAGKLNQEANDLAKAYYYFMRAIQVAEIDIAEQSFYSLAWENELLLIADCNN